MIPNAENASATAAAGTASSNPRSRSGKVMRNVVHCRIEDARHGEKRDRGHQDGRDSSPAAGSRRRASSKTAARVVTAAQKCSWWLER